MTINNDQIEAIKELIAGNPSSTLAKAIKDIIDPPPVLDAGAILDYLGVLLDHPKSHFHLYRIDRPNFCCANCGYTFKPGEDIAFVMEIKSEDTTTFIRFCFNRDKKCGAFQHLRSFRWLREAFPTSVSS